jgi:hypothetical protein
MNHHQCAVCEIKHLPVVLRPCWNGIRTWVQKWPRM